MCSLMKVVYYAINMLLTLNIFLTIMNKNIFCAKIIKSKISKSAIM